MLFKGAYVLWTKCPFLSTFFFVWRNYNFWGREVGEKTTILDSYLDENERGGIRGNQPKLVIFGCTLNLSNFKKKK